METVRRIHAAGACGVNIVLQQRRPNLLDRRGGHLRTCQYSIRTEVSWVDWVRRFILFHGKRHLAEMDAADVAVFLTYLRCSAS